MGSVSKEDKQKSLSPEELGEYVGRLAVNFEKVQVNAKEVVDRRIPKIRIGLAAWKRAKDDCCDSLAKSKTA